MDLLRNNIMHLNFSSFLSFCKIHSLFLQNKYVKWVKSFQIIKLIVLGGLVGTLWLVKQNWNQILNYCINHSMYGKTVSS